MSYRLKADESVPQGLKRIVREELDDAIRQLSGKKAGRNESIHEARTSIKKVRAALKLVRKELGSTYRRENARLRDAAHRLSEIRDAGAMITAFDAVCDHGNKPWNRGAQDAIRRALLAHQSKVEREGNLRRLLPQIADSIAGARDPGPGWPLRRGGFGALKGSFEKSFRDGRKALSHARKNSRPEHFHELRKRVKDHWYHVRLLEDLWDGMMTEYEKTLKGLETRLGDDHNLVLLHDLVAAAPRQYGTPDDIRLLFGKITRYQKQLRREALQTAKRVYSERPRQLMKRFHALWTVWRKSGT